MGEGNSDFITGMTLYAGIFAKQPIANDAKETQEGLTLHPICTCNQFLKVMLYLDELLELLEMDLEIDLERDRDLEDDDDADRDPEVAEPGDRDSLILRRPRRRRRRRAVGCSRANCAICGKVHGEDWSWSSAAAAIVMVEKLL